MTSIVLFARKGLNKTMKHLFVSSPFAKRKVVGALSTSTIRWILQVVEDFRQQFNVPFLINVFILYLDGKKQLNIQKVSTKHNDSKRTSTSELHTLLQRTTNKVAPHQVHG